ncbi:hypothetical protein FIBSPDRAFT_852960 [Athelia psychrophila]|uniref:Uncharacterized protein n=1 Tax=Athelia psychrophila TaxID=1759441 RepID=A0A166RBU6_9AGAM|nr:hypothetical protein FIBSPDRAFT_852960 [Fibularhizoctonia sp. CBS 109695]
MGFGANAEKVCAPTEKEVLEIMGFARGTKKATPGCTVKTQEYDAQIGAQVSVSVGASARVQRLSGGMGGAQAPAHPTMARQEPIVERCDPGNSTNIGVGVKIDSSVFFRDSLSDGIAVPLSRVAIPYKASSNAKETGIPRSVLRSTNMQPQISSHRRSPAAVSRKSDKENMSAKIYMNPRAAPAPPPSMSPFIRRAIQAMKEWDADIAEDPFWAV